MSPNNPLSSGSLVNLDFLLPQSAQFDETIIHPFLFILLLAVVSKFSVIGQSFMKNLVFLKQVFLKIGYPLSIIDSCFKTFVDELFIKRPQLTIVEMKTLFLSLPYIGKISLQTRTKLRKSLKGLLTANFKLFLKAKGNSEMFSISEILYLSI